MNDVGYVGNLRVDFASAGHLVALWNGVRPREERKHHEAFSLDRVLLRAGFGGAYRV